MRTEFGLNLEHAMKEAVAIVKHMREPITTRHVGTIAFQGTDAQINEAMQRYFGERK